MTTNNENEESGGIGFNDICYTLFRHKWKILFLSLAGVAIAAGLFLRAPLVYQSDAKLFLHYVIENKAPGPIDNQSEIRMVDRRGENVLNSEREILLSLDLARMVVTNIGAERILSKAGGGNHPELAAAVVHNGLTVELPRRSNIILLSLRHPDRELVNVILDELIESYFRRHFQIHRALGIHEGFLAQQSDRFRAQLSDTEDELKRLRNEAGVISPQEARAAYSAMATRLQEEVLTAEAELAEYRETFKEAPPGDGTAQPEPAVEAELLAETLAEYDTLVNRLHALRQREVTLLNQFTPSRPLVSNLQAQIREVGTAKAALELKYPRLRPAPGTGTDPARPLFDERTRMAALEKRAEYLRNRLAQLQGETSQLVDLETRARQLERKKEVEEENYRFYAASLEKAQIENAMGTGKISNITKIQHPSVPRRIRTHTDSLIALGGGVGIALALAFFLEMVVDQKVRRPGQIESRLGLPLFMTLPVQRRRLLPRIFRRKRKGAAPGSSVIGLVENDINEGLRDYCSALRDRMISDFDARNMTKKPKMIAVTGCSKGSGVSTLARGLAAALAENKETGVLLVDMTQTPMPRGGDKRQFLEDLLQKGDNRADTATTNLAMAHGASSESGDGGLVVPAKFRDLAPQLRASDYDYIIFDMPQVKQTSITPCLNRFMDMTFLVIESEKTGMSAVDRACKLMKDSKGKLVTVLNKHRSYLPQWVEQEV